MSMHKLPLPYILNKNKYYTKNTNINNQRLKKIQFNEWFVGFSDAESNFLIGLDNRGKYTRFNFRFTIGLHIDDKSLLEYIKIELGCGRIEINKENTVAYFIVADTNEINSVLIPIFENFPLNTTKYLDYLSFKEALLINSIHTSNLEIRSNNIKKILELKNNMNKNRTKLNLPLNHIKITPFWLLGLIEGEGSFHLRRSSLTPAFSLTLTQSQKPVIEEIISFLISNLDHYSSIKATNTKLFNLSIEKSRGGAKPQVKLSIFQLDYLFNIFIPFLDSLNFQSKKALDFQDFKYITTLIYQGKHLIPEIKSFILQLSNTMNNFRLSTHNNNLNKLLPIINEKNADNKVTILSNLKNKYLIQSPLYVKNNEGQIINNETKEIIRDTYVIEVIKTDKTISIYPTVTNCALAFGITRQTIYDKIISGKSLNNKAISKINKVRVFLKIL